MGQKKRLLGDLDGVQFARSLNRRGFIGLSGALGAGALLATSLSAQAVPKIKSKAKIVIAGAGAAGLAAASRLSDRLDGAEIILVDGRKAHFYQPGFTLVAGGIKSADYPVSTTAEYVPRSATWIEEYVSEFDPESNSITTASGQKISYDYLLVTTGLMLNYAGIEGMDEQLIGKDGLGSIYHSPQAAAATWQLLDRFADSGGDGVFLRPATEMKCAGAPLKYTFITDDHLRRRDNRSKAKLTYNAHSGNLFSVPIVHEKLRMLFENRGIETHYNRVLSAIDPGKRIATFTSVEEGSVELPYDFINVVPPMRAPEAIRNSPLPWQDGKWASDGWLEVSKDNLRHARYQNVFAIGDIAGVPKGKTAASVKWQTPVVVDHLVAEIAGKESEMVYNGYTSCPLITRLGRAMLIEFDYRNNLVPSFPGVIAPLEELWATWVIKTVALKPTYISMLRGSA
ncbi:NAD(P)/FAD-dependent oxidoreductase [Suttonella sp. R2A3]|uniref:NAD(P)/FAD-dependent oxidoreductase n=1 Tax=Suttonella sp. R2A3 TaxID=2908648 RepID=UPI001F260083|nr:FAD/NAD(P)-binding oxidoreductase [Suttonella sp. R2A3]UJF23817.1 NAD(P)/FAD-dependent oxidoreductase [Suttonella sp. R2A3]